jgi:hypothetical protein
VSALSVIELLGKGLKLVALFHGPIGDHLLEFRCEALVHGVVYTKDVVNFVKC